MRAIRVFATSILGLSLTIVLLFSVASAADENSHHDRKTVEPTVYSADGALSETDLISGGAVWEVNDDGRGNLWLSDYGGSADAVWQVNRATGAYTIYNGFDGPDDARRDSGDNVWLTEYDGSNLARIEIATGIVTTWTLPGAYEPWGTTFDDLGHVWVVDYGEPLLFRFNMTSTQVCSYTLPQEGASTYVHHDDGVIWIGDYENYRIAKFDPSTSQYTYFQLPAERSMEGFEIDQDGSLWYADYDYPELGHFYPSQSKLITYALPYGDDATMIALDGPYIGYTEGTTGTFGLLNPSVAISVSTELTSTTVPLTQTCVSLGPGITRTATISNGVLPFAAGVYTLTTNSGGWQTYRLPPESDPYPIVSVDNHLWIGDKGRDKLIKFALPAIEVEKTPLSQTVTSGTPATFTIRITNTGSVTLANVSTLDALTPSCDASIGLLAVGESNSYECSQASVSTDFTNTLVATGSPVIGGGPPYTDTWNVSEVGTATVHVKPLDSTYMPYLHK